MTSDTEPAVPGRAGMDVREHDVANDQDSC
jgi:hypothetical protein